MEHLLFIFYLLLFCWLVTKTAFFRQRGPGKKLLTGIFLLKVAAGIIYGLKGASDLGRGQLTDSWAFHFESIRSYHILLKSPGAFFTDLFQNNYPNGYGGFFASKDSWWNDLPGNVFILVLSFFDLFSLGNYYTNVLFYSFLTLAGPLALYRVMKDRFPDRPAAVFAGVFLLPSFLFWTSGIHKDGLVFTALALVIYSMHRWLGSGRLDLQKALLMAGGLLVILAFRNYLLMLLLPALGAWWLSEKWPYRPLPVFLLVYLAGGILFFTAPLIYAPLDFPAAVTNTQKAFLALKGNSAIPVPLLQPTFSSFVKAAPAALANALLRPFPTDVKDLPGLAASLEAGCLAVCILLFLFYRQRNNRAEAFVLFCLFFSFSVLMTIGDTVNFIGAIVRYRATVLPLLVSPIICLLKPVWKRPAGDQKH